MPMNLRALFRKVESHLNAIENQRSLKKTLGLLIESILTDFEGDFGFTGARLYIQDDGHYRLEAKFGARNPAPLGFSIPKTYPPIQALLRTGFVYMGLESKGVDEALEKQLGVARFAAITVGAHNHYLIAFSLKPEKQESEDDVLFALSSIRHAINIKLAKENLEGIILQSKEIQLSLLPEEDVRFPGYDIAGRSVPAEVVGGDVFDYIQINPKILGVAIGDATGHGLPAALQARDAVIGLRMGMSEDQKMVKAFEKMNRVVYRSRLTSRFVSLFYGELEVTGHFIYCNAGHTTPYYYRVKKDRFYPMSEGGPVLGPVSNATYQRGFFRLEPGDCLILFTDGLTEAKNSSGEEYGECRILDYVRGHLAKAASREIINGLIDEVAAFTAPDSEVDDRTVVLVKRLP